VVIIGLDGVPCRLIKDLTEKDIMPETKKLIDKGLLTQMQSSIPEISSVAWSSVITGKNPGEHGIFGYTDIPVGTYRLSFPNFNSLKAAPFWQKNSNQKSIILNVPSTFPVKPLNGIHISGFVSLDFKRSVYPNSLIPKLQKLNYKIDVDSSKAHKSLDLFLKDLDFTLKARIATYRTLWNQEDWDVFMLVFTGTDRLAHFLWSAYEDEAHKYHNAFLDHFHQIDEAIGEIASQITEKDLLILLSDHGFESLKKEVNINFILKESGLLKINSDSRRYYADIDESTEAFALEPSRIYLNLKEKFPRGSVTENDYEKLITDITSIFSALQYKDQKVIKKTLRKEEIYNGEYIHSAPDLVLLSNSGFNLKASLKATQTFEDSVFTGKHTQHDAFLLIGNKSLENIIPEYPSVSDILTIIDKSSRI